MRSNASNGRHSHTSTMSAAAEVGKIISVISLGVVYFVWIDNLQLLSVICISL